MRGRLDLPGSVSVTAGTAALVSAVILGEEHGWASATTLACLALAVASFVVFVLVERRAEQPVVPLWVFRVRPVTVANGSSALVGGVLPATMFFLVLYLQRVLGMDPLQAGLALTPGAVGHRARRPRRLPLDRRRSDRAAASCWARWCRRRRSPGCRGIDVEGRYAVGRAGPADPGHGRLRAAGLPLTVTATSGLGPERAGLASGLLATARQVGSAVGLAALVAVADRVGGGPGRRTPRPPLTAGFGVGLPRRRRAVASLRRRGRPPAAAGRCPAGRAAHQPG